MSATAGPRELPLDAERWSFPGAAPARTTYRGRECVRLDTGAPLAVARDVELLDGALEIDLAVAAGRSFPGVAWRVAGPEDFESFFVRPHQVGNPDAVQYTPVWNGVPAWQLYHGAGFWAPVTFPVGDWFRIRVVFVGARADVYVGDLAEPALVCPLRRPPAPGGVGVASAGPPIHVARFAVERANRDALRGPEPPAPEPDPRAVPAWSVSDPFEEGAIAAGGALLDRALVAARTWTRLACEPSGLADLARVNGVRDGRNTVLARATVTSPSEGARLLELGFSDRAVVYLNGRALFRGDDGYRTRDYRFLGSIGWWDAVYLPLREGDNDLVVAVSEDFGGWGLQARFPDPAGLRLA